MLLRHLFQQRLRIVLVHHVDTVANTLRMPPVNRLPDVKAQAFGRNETRSQFAGVQRDVHFRVDGMQILDHLHLQGVVAHGNEAVFGHYKIDADPGVVMSIHGGLHRLKTQKRLRENLLR